ncbi:hypothetical protein AOZ06_47885 [Kibdelosporangium phytohabitans]|uniref:Uncharacterized protein n=1 Tax=Kibdelosporangium phytohabitans TaxID=860235 RepID=A0A0N9IFH6_9PSEU|nr:hypothetical protein AOZ06_47885 [Kibdelosporangium phytohabitans]
MSFAVVADVLSESDSTSSAVALEGALRLRCQAAVIEAMAELHDELGSQLRAADTYTGRFV